MISDLVQLIFYNNGTSDYVSDLCLWIESLYNTSVSNSAPITSFDFGSLFIPWDQILACVVLCVFIVCLFKFMRTIFTKIL